MGQCLIVRLDGDASQMFADLWRGLFLIHKQNHVILGNVAVGEEERVEGNVRTAHIEEPANFICEVEIEINLKMYIPNMVIISPAQCFFLISTRTAASLSCHD